MVRPGRQKSERPLVYDVRALVTKLLEVGFILPMSIGMPVTHCCLVFLKHFLVLVDSDFALCAIDVLDILYQQDVYLHVAPRGLGWMCLPCDQRVHSVMKRSYYRMLATSGPSLHSPTEHEKFLRWRKAFWSVRPHIIQSMFKATGVCSNINPDTIVHHLFSEGHRLARSFLPLHQHQLRAYLRWRKENGLGFGYLKQQLHTFKGGPFFDVVMEFVDTD